MLKEHGNLDVIDEAGDGRTAVRLVLSKKPDLVLMDAAIPDMNGFEASRRLKSRDAAPLVVLLAFHDSHAAQLEAWAAGADGFVAKADITHRLMPLLLDLIRQHGLDKKKEMETSFSTKQGAPRDLRK